MDRQQRSRLERHIRESQCPWGYVQVRDFARRAREPWGTGWTLLGHDLQVLAVRAQVCLILQAQWEESRHGSRDVSALETAMLLALGLQEEED